MRQSKNFSIAIIGGGPSGMAAALQATRSGAQATVLERLDRVGGLARTVSDGDNRFDIGPHRFFTLNEEIKQLFIEICGDDIVHVPRLTRIFYRNRFFDYPLTPLNALFGVGVIASFQILGSYIAARCRRLFSKPDLVTFEDWVVDRFGRRLFETFFKTYTEKVWGIPCREIGAGWAGQRIKGLSLTTAIINALFRPKKNIVKTLVDQFMYPRRGAGQLYEKMETIVTEGGGTVRKNIEVVRIRRQDFRIEALDCCNAEGTIETQSADFFLSSAPLTNLLEQMDPPPPDEVLTASRCLRYRHHVAVELVVEGDTPFPDNWIYIHSPDVKMARVASYRNFSTAMSDSPRHHPLTVEYFCFADDEIWKSTDQQLIGRASAELAKTGICRSPAVRGFVVRSAQAYPVIEIGYHEKIATIKAFLDRFENFLPIGRSGMFKYNNQDHAMATGIYAVRTALREGTFDPWRVNIDGVYQESATAE